MWWAQLCTKTLSLFHRLWSLNLHHVVLRHHKFLPHFPAFPFLFPGLDLSWIQRPLVQMVFLLLLLKREKTERNDSRGCLIQFDIVCLAWMNMCLSLCACVSLSWYPWCPAASSPSIGQRSRRDQYKTSGPLFHHPYGELFTNVIITSGYQLY